jgi:hypothetical protein
MTHASQRANGGEAMVTRLAWASIWSADLNSLLPFDRDVPGLEGSVQTAGFGVRGALSGGAHN